jgi:hypothetical protein
VMTAPTGKLRGKAVVRGTHGTPRRDPLGKL